MIRKAASRGADVLVLDLEDGVHPSRKDAARTNLAEARAALAAGGAAVALRVNAPETAGGRRDLEAARGAGFDAVVLPKAERREAVRRVRARLGPGTPIWLMIETAGGAAAVFRLAAERGGRGARLRIRRLPPRCRRPGDSGRTGARLRSGAPAPRGASGPDRLLGCALVRLPRPGGAPPERPARVRAGVRRQVGRAPRAAPGDPRSVSTRSDPPALGRAGGAGDGGGRGRREGRGRTGRRAAGGTASPPGPPAARARAKAVAAPLPHASLRQFRRRRPPRAWCGRISPAAPPPLPRGARPRPCRGHRRRGRKGPSRPVPHSGAGPPPIRSPVRSRRPPGTRPRCRRGRRR